MPTTTSRHRAPAATVAVLGFALVAAGCNLAFNLNDFPYQGNTTPTVMQDMPADTPADIAPVVPDASGDVGVVDMVADTGADLDMVDLPTGTPQLIFTEIMINTTGTPENAGDERGEYIEIKNVGTAAADPRLIGIESVDTTTWTIRVDSDNPDPGAVEARQVLQPIAPGEYFVFLRDDDPSFGVAAKLEQGRYYEYGQWVSNDIALANTQRRRIQLRYALDGQVLLQDEVGWDDASFEAGLAGKGPEGAPVVTENVALSIGPAWESAEGNDDPRTWCYEQAFVDLASPLRGSPGSGAQEQTCTANVPN